MDNPGSESNSSEALDMHSAADAFGSLMSGEDTPNDAPAQTAQADEGPEAAAERLAAEEMSRNEPDKAPAGAAPAPAEPVTVEIDGKPVTLTREQIAEHYKNGLRQADYTRKTMEAAEARKSAEAEAAKARQEREVYAQQLNSYVITNESLLREQAATLTQELLESNPVEYLTQERIFKERQAKLAQAHQELSQLNQQQQHEQAESQRTYFQQQQEQLLAKLPEWKDPAKAEADVTALKNYLGTQDFGPDERVFPDHRMVILARKAMQYDALIERAGKAVKKVATLPAKAERSGTPDAASDKRTEALKRLGKTGSINDAANAFAQFM